MAAMPISNVNVQLYNQRQHFLTCSIAMLPNILPTGLLEAAAWLTICYSWLFSNGGLFNVADFCDRIYLSLICLLNLLDILGQRNLGCQRLLKTFYNHKTFC